MQNKLYVAYGSNMNISQMKQRCPGAQVVEKGMIQDMQIQFNKVATLHNAPGEQAPAVIWSLTSKDEEKLDIYEGYPHKYTKNEVIVDINGEEFPAMAYIMNDNKRLGAPSDEYFNRIAEGYTYFGFDFLFLEEAYDRALEYEDVYNISFFDKDYKKSNEIRYPSDDLISKAFVIGQYSERYRMYFNKEEITSLTISMLEDFEISSPFFTFEEYVEDAFIQMHDEYVEEKLYYVAYGSNMNLDQMKSRCPHSTCIGTGEIIDYKLQFCNYADIRPESEAITPCVLWEIDYRDWPTLDSYEGYPSLYIKDEVDVIFNGARVAATAYIMNSDKAIPNMPSKVYLDGIFDAYEQHGINTEKLTQALSETSKKQKAIKRSGRK